MPTSLKSLVTPQLAIGDLLTTARTLDASFLLATGGVYTKSAYPTLASALGSIGGDVGVNWTSVASGFTSVIGITRSNNGTMIGITTLSNIIVRSTDNGVTWASINAGTSTTAVDIDTDGNGKWIIQLSSGTPSQRVSIDDGLTWGGGAAGPATSNMVFNKYVGNNTWVCGGANQLWRSTNNAVSWVGDGSKAPNTGSAFATDRNGVCIMYIPSGTTIGTFRSIDAFVSSTSISPTTGPAGPFTIATDGKGTWLIGGLAGALSRSLDNGQTFAAVSSGTAAKITSVATDGNGVWMIGGSAILRRSKDNLNSFDTVSGTASSVQSTVLTSSFAVAGSNNGQIYRSVPAYSYDTATQFAVPNIPTPPGVKAYIKAL